MPNKPHAPRAGPKKPNATTTTAGSSKDAANTSKKGKGAAVKDEDGTKSTSKKTKTDLKAPPPADEIPKKPDTRALIGGASWTGKLPMTLLAELCQKQKWHKPEYTMVERTTCTWKVS